MLKHMIWCGDSLELIKKIAPSTCDLIVTSPPYWGLRIYNGGGELGSDATPELYVRRLADFFDAMRPVLKPTANMFINLGDTYFGSSYCGGPSGMTLRADGVKCKRAVQPRIKCDGALYQNGQMLMIPARFAIEMQSRGWILREDIIWHKTNRAPLFYHGRFNNAHEHIFHFVLAKGYYFDDDAVKIPTKTGFKKASDVWSIPVNVVTGTKHTAMYPERLVDRIVRCASPKGGCVLDPFLGSGTTWIVCERRGRSCIGFEINPDYLEFALERYSRRYGNRPFFTWNSSVDTNIADVDSAGRKCKSVVQPNGADVCN